MDTCVGPSTVLAERQPILLQGRVYLTALLQRQGLWPEPPSVPCLHQRGARFSSVRLKQDHRAEAWLLLSRLRDPRWRGGLPPASSPTLSEHRRGPWSGRPQPCWVPALCTLPEARRRWWGEGLACTPTEPGAGCSEQSCPSASQKEKLHPRVTKQSSSSAAE